MAHPDGELATVRVVTTMNTAMALSAYSTYSIEDVARESPNTVKFCQMQFFSDRQLTEMLIKRAEKAGYSAVLITVDTPRFSKHKGRAGFSLPRHLKFANFVSLQGNWKRGLKSNSEVEIYLKAVTDSSVVWESLDWLRSITSLPIVVKGILTAEDARLAANMVCKGFWFQITEVGS